ncbi:ABC transporter substrate binding protein [Paenibacillus puerhi]|uniref:ABC transporter substrate binding protein n=1 Tax=Paenibacillus puerhi TaxID=2692622 RepID=UPI001357DC2B|nr:ABC transporter substrate binding protein [Paenibacillus puerhi]
MRRRLAGMAVLLAACVLASSCSSGSADAQPRKGEEKRQIALILKSGESDFWQAVRNGAEAAAKEFNVELIAEATADEEQVSEQVRRIEEAVHYRRDALVVAANDGKAAAAAVERAAAARMPVVALDTEVESSRVHAFIGIDHYEAGVKAGSKLAELLEGQGRVALLGFKLEESNASERERGVRAALAAYPAIRVGETAYCASNGKLCELQAAELLGQDEPVAGLVALHAASSSGLARQIDRLGMKERVKAVAFDIEQEDIEYLQEGVIQATVAQNPFSMGYLGVKASVELLRGGKPPERYDTGTTVIDRSNMFWSDNQKLLFPFVK